MKNNWFYRRIIIFMAMISGIGMGIGLFFTSTAQAGAISGSITTIVLSLLGIASAYTAGAVADDHSKRINKDG